MQSQLLHTPEGVRDIYGKEGERKRYLEQMIYNRFKLGGYQDIQTPGFEFFDVFRKERGSVSVKDMYRFFDREGNTLVLRPDYTPAIARCVSNYYQEKEGPLRFCYQGPAYVNNSGYQGKLKETTQMGVELVQEPSVYADAELLVLAVESLREAGLSEFQIEVGHAGFFSGIMAQTKLLEEEKLELRTLIEDKYTYGVDAFLTEHAAEVPGECQKILHKLPECFGNMEDLFAIEALTEAFHIPGAKEALGRLEELERILSLYDCSGYVTYDLGMLGKRNYYTGIIFRGYTYGTGEAIVSGGRYDHLVAQFGKDVPAVGMAVGIDQLLLALDRQKKEGKISDKKVLVVCGREQEEDGICQVQDLHRQGMSAVLWVEDNLSEEQLQKYAKENGFSEIHGRMSENQMANWIENCKRGEDQ